MPNPDAHMMVKDIQKLDDLYEELLWDLMMSYNLKSNTSKEKEE